MKIEKREEERIIKDVFTIYIAKDGAEFETERECKRYEEAKEKERRLEKLDRFIVKEFENMFPIHDDGSFSEFMYYTWLKADNKEELNELRDILGERLTVFGIENTFPFYICFETEEEFSGEPSEWYYTLDESKRITQSYFERFGYEVIFRRKEVICES